MKSDREYRAFQVNAQDDEKRVTGYATTFDEPYTLFSDGDYEVREVIDPGAFDNCDMSDVIAQYNHEGRVLARLSNGTLKLNIDKSKGLEIDADLGGTELGRQIYEEIKGGYTNRMSMGFKVDKSADVWTRQETDGKTIEERRVMSVVKLYDVSAVSIPANPGTSIEARSIDTLVKTRNREKESRDSGKTNGGLNGNQRNELRRITDPQERTRRGTQDRRHGKA